jgi:hypothetical protein
VVPLLLGEGAHTGDNEVVSVQVVFNASTSHWEFDGMWTSAHYQWGEGDSDWYLIPLGKGGLEYSEWSDRNQVSFYSRYLAFPEVWVGANKHANYRSSERCNNGVDYCSSYNPVRFAVHAAHNAGSQYVDLIGCIASPQPEYTLSGRTECFYTNRGDGFQGWNAIQEGKLPRAYYYMLGVAFTTNFTY